MSRADILLTGSDTRQRAISWVQKAPPGTRLIFQAPRRTLDQNARMWASLTDVARQTDWHGQKLSTEDWKVLFMAALNTELRIVPNLDGTGFVPLGRSSSELGKDEMSQLIELIAAFSASHGIALGGTE